MKTGYVIGIVAIILIAGGVVWHLKGTTPAEPAQDMATSTDMSGMDMSGGTVIASTTTTVTTTTTTTPAPQHFTVHGNDQTADLKIITVAAGTPVTITFGADAGSTYHGGLDYRSSVVNSGTIAPGSTKDVTFTATKSFSFTPYWPASNIAKPYTIDVIVK